MAGISPRGERCRVETFVPQCMYSDGDAMESVSEPIFCSTERILCWSSAV